MKNTILIAAAILSLASCSTDRTGDWVHFSSYHEYVVLNNNDTVKYVDGWNMQGLTSGATKRRLTSEEQAILLDYLDSMCRTDTRYEKFEDKAIKWQRNYPGQTLGYMMKFLNHEVLPQYQNLKVEDVKTIVCDYDSTYQTYMDDNEIRQFYEIFD